MLSTNSPLKQISSSSRFALKSRQFARVSSSVTASILLLCCASNSFGAPEKDVSDQPNILFILIDDMGWKDMGCAGSTYYETPNIDALAASGIRFKNAYSSSCVCAPSRGAIFSGKNPARTKFTTVYNGKAATDDRLHERSKIRGGVNQYYEALHRHNLPKSEILFSKALGDAGYATGFFGKWHCGVHGDYVPDKRGFQVAKGYRTKHVGTSVSQHWGKAFKKYAANMDNIKDDDYVADILTTECINFIKANKKKPFLAVMSHYLSHGPIQPKPEKLDKYKGKPTTDQNSPAYAAVMESVDESVGRLMATLKELNIADNTLVVFTSDNGGLSPGSTSNYPLLGGKSFGFEAGTRVPLIMSWQGVIKPGRTIKEKMIGMDLYPTFLEAAGAELMPKQHADGISLMPVLKDAAPMKGRPLIFHYPHYTGYTPPYSSIIDGDWKLIRFYNDEKGAYLLFDLNRDEGEQTDLSTSKPEVVQRLVRRLDLELKSMNAELPIKNPNYVPDSKILRNRETSYDRARKHRALLEKRVNTK